jgi:heterodisulfide reductase subunit C1
MELYNKLKSDVRFIEGLKSCMNCGVCTAICPAAEFFDYDPRVLLSIVQSKNDSQIEELLKSDIIWACGQCMSCKTRCPRGNCPGMIISVLRKFSQEMGYFTESKKGRQQYAIVKAIGKTMLEHGYCVYPGIVNPAAHPEQGPVWEWIYNNKADVYERLGANLDTEGAGALRKIADKNLAEVKAIFDQTGGTAFFETIENFSKQKAKGMGMVKDDGTMDKYTDRLMND